MNKKVAVLIASAVASAGFAQDVVTSRYSGMAGAGLALPIGVGSRGSLNPSLYGFEKKRLSLDAPAFGVHTSGITTGELRKDLKLASSSKHLDAATLTHIARDLGSQEAELGAGFEEGLMIGDVHVGFESQAAVATVPNAPLMREAQAGVFSDLNDNLDAYGYGYWSLDLGFGHEVPLAHRQPGQSLVAGARVRFIHSYFAHRFVSGNEIVQTDSATPGFGAEMGGQTTERKAGIAADFGLDYSVGRKRPVYFGAVVHNLITPNLAFGSTLPDEQGFGIPGEVKFNPFKRQYDFGTGFMPTKRIAIAADMVDIGNQAGRCELRTGVDFALNRWINLQAGYGSRRAFVAGFGIGGFNIAFGRRVPLSLSGMFHF